MVEKFKIHDLVEITMWKGDIACNWIITDFVSNDDEAILHHIGKGEQAVIELKDLKHQKREVKNDVERI